MARDETFEEILETVGNMGCAQVMIILLSIAIEATVGMTVNYFVLESGPRYDCVTLGSLNSTAAVYSSTGSCDNTTGGCYNSTVQVYTGKCPVAGEACTNVTFLDGYTSIVTEWNLTCDNYYLVKLTASIFFAGLLVGAFFGGQLSDMFGRRPILLVAWTGLIAAQAFLALANMWPIYATLRFMAGVFAGCCATVASILPMEYVGVKWRPLVGMRLGWGVAHFLIVLMAYFLRPWQHLALGTSLPFTPFLLLSFVFLPESSRWLIQKQRHEAGFKWLKFVARINRRPPPDPGALRRVGRAFAEAEKAAGHYSYAHLFATKTYAVRSVVLLMGWFTCSMVSYGLKSQWASLTGSIYINMLIAAGTNIFVRFLAPVIFNWTGRRPSYAISLALPIIAMFTITIMDVTGQMEGREMVRTSLALISYAVSIGAWMSVFLLTNEIYPTLIRNIASGAGNTSSRIAGVLAPQVALLKVFHPALPYIFFGVLAIAESILITIVMPETMNRPLPDEPPPKIRQVALKEQGDSRGRATSRDYVVAANEDSMPDNGDEIEMILMGDEKDYANRTVL